VTDNLAVAATKDLSLTIVPAPAITTASLNNGEAGIAYSRTLAVSGGTPPYAWSIQSGTLPAGLTLNPTSGNITGTPSSSFGPAVITFKVTDNLAVAATKDLSMTITPAPSITTTSLNNGAAGLAYSQTLAASGGTAPYTWSIQSGTLPAGLTLNPASGNITGTPSSAGDFSFSIKLTDSFSTPQIIGKILTLKIFLRGDASGDGTVNMGDVTKVERIILGLEAPTAGADANGDGSINMGDVTSIERIILGLSP
jgi:hypothetical protein